MADYHRPDQQTLQTLRTLANKIRILSVESTDAAGTGHPTSCASMADILAVLFGHVMRYSLKEPRHPSSDRFVLSKGHGAPGLYAAWAEMGLFPVAEMKNLRKLTSDLEGHPTPRLSFIDVATGSLGHGLSLAAGMAYTGKYFESASYRVYCLIGDGESAEGSVWEAMAFASHYKLDNMVAIFDVNRLGQSEPTSLQHDMDTYKRRCEAFGFHTYVIDGHDVDAVCKAFHEATTVKDKPVAILAKTFKGYGFPEISDKENWHGKPLGAKSAETLKKLHSEVQNGAVDLTPRAMVDDCRPIPKGEKIAFNTPLTYELGQKVATRNSYGDALVRLGKSCSRVVAMDGDTKNSTFSIKFRDAFPNRFIECFVAEQNLVGVGIGCGTRDRTIPFVSTFGAFLSRGFDQIRMGAVSQTNCNFAGSHVGVSIGEDGPSQMALEDIAMFRSVATSTVFYPSDAVSCERAVELAANTKGICYIRTSRPATPVIYANDEQFCVGKGKVVRSSANDKVTVVGAGITLAHAVLAHERLASEGIHIRVVDPFTVKPIDAELLKQCAKSTNGKVISVEDHYYEGGLGEAISSALNCEPNVSVHMMAVKEVPRSGKPDELLEMFGINHEAIYKKVKSLL